MTRFAAKLFPSALALLLAACTTAPSRVDPTVQAARPLADHVPTSPSEARAKVHVELGMAYLQAGRVDVALDEASVALAESSSYAPAYHLKGLVYMMVDDSSQAESNFRRALAMAPGDPDFNNSYGWFLCTEGREADGLERLALAARNPYYRTPTRPYTNAGLCYLRTGNDAAAVAQFQRAVDADPSNTQALYSLASIAYRQGDFAGARGYLIRLHQQSDPTPESAWLGLRTERRLGNREAEASYAAQLRSRFAGSPEFQSMQQGNYE
jgi:type IV pilus assembly protein PilF